MASRKIEEFKRGANVVKVSFNPEYKEFRARIYSNGIANENADYFSEDRADTLQTAQTMLKECTRVVNEPSIKAFFAGQLENI